MAQNNKSNKNKQTKQAQQQQSGKKSAQHTVSQHKKKQSNLDEKKCGCCKWVLGSIFLIALIAGALVYDTNVNGEGIFEQSASGKLLKNAGLLPHVEKAWYFTMSNLARGYKWAAVYVPQIARPIGKLFCDVYKLMRNGMANTFVLIENFLNPKLHVAGDFLEQYIPGSTGYIVTCYEFFVSVWKSFYGYLSQMPQLMSYTFSENGPQWGENTWRMYTRYRKVFNDNYNLFHKKVDVYAKL